MNKKEEKSLEEEEEASSIIERREHMFDKVVTPSDVGKLNRLVIPKQHAERYFPLDQSSSSTNNNNNNNKGLLLSFEDIKGNSSTWRFRYSYWNSSQSYVMTKGWSRFVKDKSLVAGDIVSFLRDSCNKEKLFIGWRRRPKMMIQEDQDHHHFSRGAMLMMPRFYSFPHNLYHRDLGVGYYVRDPTAVIHESVPLMMMMNQRRAQVASIGGRGGKRLRLFGVDIMEESCGGGGSVVCTEEEEDGGCVPRGDVSLGGVGSLLKMRLVSDDSLVAMEDASVIEDHHHFFTKKGKCSTSFNLDR